MAINPKELISKINDYKVKELEELKKSSSQVKQRLEAIKSTLYAKKDEFLVLEQEAKEKAEQEALEQARIEAENKAAAEAAIKEQLAKEEKKEEKVEEKPVVEEKKEGPVKEEVKVEEKPEEVKPVEVVEPIKEEKKEEPKKPSKPLPQPKTPFEKIVVDENGNARRVYVAPQAPPKDKPQKLITKVFGPNGYQNKKDNKNQNQQQNQGQNQKPQQNKNVGANNASLANAAQQFPPKKDNSKGKGKPNASANSGNGKFEDKNAMNKRALTRKGYVVDDRVSYDEDGEEIVRTFKQKNQKSQQSSNQIKIEHAVINTDPVAIKTLSEKIGKTGAEIIKTLFMLGIMKTMNDSIDFATAELIAGEFGITLELKAEATMEQTLSNMLEDNDLDDLDKLVPRAPVVTIMGHVDHGKSSILDYIRQSHITAGEAGGITQAIGAYTVSLKGKKITFLDTPGHEAFTAMRARGAQVTDIAVLVVAADDGIMPQTIESISHAKQAKVPIIVAINKMDKPTANPDVILSQLTQYDITPEEWGGDTPCVRVSAKTGQGIDDLLENILLRAEVDDLRANPDRKAKGSIIEARLDSGLGKVATVLVQNGTLKIGDYVVAGTSTGRIRAMIDDKGKNVKKAGPSIPVSVTGWDDIPEAGDGLVVVDNAKFAKDLALERQLKIEQSKNQSSAVSLADLFAKAKKGELKSVKLIIKADVQGSVEAVKQSLAELGNEEVSIDIIHSAVGGIKESDVLLAETSGAIIIGFNVRPDTNAKTLAAQKKIDIRFYNIIYNAIDDISNAVKGLLAPKFEEVILGSAEVREIFKISGVGNIAGSHVVEGKVVRGAKARLIRNGKVEYTGEIGSLQHGKDAVKEMQKNFDCGIMLTNYQDVKVGDIIEAFQEEQVDEG